MKYIIYTLQLARPKTETLGDSVTDYTYYRV